MSVEREFSEASDRDCEWFEKNLTRKFRFRSATPAEVRTLFHGYPVLPDGHTVFIVTKKIGAGVRARLPFVLPASALLLKWTDEQLQILVNARFENHA